MIFTQKIPGQKGTGGDAAPAARIERRLALRADQRASFVARVRSWAERKESGLAGLDLARDRARVIGLGVPCPDCGHLVFADGDEGHEVHVAGPVGSRRRPWPVLLEAVCGQSPAREWPAGP